MTHPLEQFRAPIGWSPDQEASGEAVCAVSHDPDLATGVNYVGPYDAPFDGVAEAVRRHALALDGAGIPVFLSSSGGTRGRRFADLEETVRQKVDTLTMCRHKESLLRVVHTILGRSTVHIAVFPRTQFELRRDELLRLQKTTVLMTVHERLTADKELLALVTLMRLLAEVWVPCSRNKRVLVEAGLPEDMVHVIPHPYDPDDLPLFEEALRQAAQSRSSPGKPFQLFNCGKWEPRKGQHELIGAFLLEFRPKDNVRLAIKTSSFGRWPGYPEGPVHSAKHWLQTEAVKKNGWTLPLVQKALTPIVDSVPREALVAMHCQADCYVSASRSEGFDLPAFDAKLAGRRMVYVRAGGPEDFASSDDIPVETEPGQLADVHKQYGWEGAKWSGYTVEQLQTALRKAYDRRSEPSQRLLSSRYSPDAVGRLMRQRVEAIMDKIALQDGTEDANR